MSRIVSLPSPSARRPASRRGAALSLELQSALKFAIAIAVALAAVLLAGREPAAIAVLPLAAALGARGLSVIAADGVRSTVRAREHAVWDSALAAALAAVALVFGVAGSYPVAAVTGVAALVLAVLSMRTRYVA